MSIYKIKKIESSIKKNVYLILFKYSNDINIKYINITKVKLCKDYSLVKIYVFFLNKDNIYINIDKLNRFSKFLKIKIFKNFNFKVFPNILFLYDKSIEKSIRILNIINSFKQIYKYE